MSGNTLQDLFQGQMDYIFFFKGLAFILVLAVCCLFRGYPSQRLPWRWFGLFALLQGLAAWLALVAMNFGNPASLKTICSLLQIASWISLAEFGRSGIGRIQNRDSGLWLIALLVMLTSLGGLKGWSGIEQASRYTLGLAGGLWAAAALFMAGHLCLHYSPFPPSVPGFPGIHLQSRVLPATYRCAIRILPGFAGLRDGCRRLWFPAMAAKGGGKSGSPATLPFHVCHAGHTLYYPGSGKPFDPIFRGMGSKKSGKSQRRGS
jgi:hypothetical protein